MEYRRGDVREIDYLVACAGSGPPVLLLHGFPETHFCWRGVVPTLAREYTVVAPDLPGYGASSAAAGGPKGEGFAKRDVAAGLIELMDTLGHERFAVVGHDRGARVAYRMALDHPQRVERLAVLNVLPTLVQFERMGVGPSLGYWPWFLLAQPAPFPERLIAAEPEHFLRFIFDSWAGEPGAIDPEAFAEYVQALPDAIAAMCADYRASFWADRRDDAADRRAGRRLECPVLLVTGAEETQLADAPTVWRAWARDLQTSTVPGGHFIPEEAADELAALLTEFLEDGRHRPSTRASDPRDQAPSRGEGR